MKAFMATIMALSISTASFAADLNQTSLKTLLSQEASVQLIGDIQEGETLKQIFTAGVLSPVKNVTNECEIKTDSPLDLPEVQITQCVLIIADTQEGGETALIYKLNVDGTKLYSPFVEVARGH